MSLGYRQEMKCRWEQGPIMEPGVWRDEVPAKETKMKRPLKTV